MKKEMYIIPFLYQMIHVYRNVTLGNLIMLNQLLLATLENNSTKTQKEEFMFTYMQSNKGNNE